MKNMIALLIATAFTAPAMAAYRIDCQGTLAKITIKIPLNDRKIQLHQELPRSAYKMNGRDSRLMIEDCQMLQMFGPTRSFGTFGCYTMASSFQFTREVTEAIDNVAGSNKSVQARAKMDKLVSDQTVLRVPFSTFDNADESTPIEKSSAKDMLFCRVRKI